MEYGILAERLLPDGRIVQITALTFGRARLHIGVAGEQTYFDEW
jgi:hypothetical protein